MERPIQNLSKYIFTDFRGIDDTTAIYKILLTINRAMLEILNHVSYHLVLKTRLFTCSIFFNLFLLPEIMETNFIQTIEAKFSIDFVRYLF